MPLFRVKMRETQYYEIEFEADNEGEARYRAFEKFEETLLRDPIDVESEPVEVEEVKENA